MDSFPESWTTVQLDPTLVEMTSGFACARKNAVPQGLPHLRPFNIGLQGEIDLSTIIHIPENFVKEVQDYHLIAGDVLFNNTNSVELVGKSAIVREPIHCAFSNHITRLRILDRKRLDPQWLLVCLRQMWSDGFFAANCNKWIGQAGFNTAKIVEVKIPLPPLEIQRRIVARLDALFAELAEARALYANIQENSNGLLDSCIRDIFDRTKDSWKVNQLADVAYVQTGTAKGRRFGSRKVVELPYLRVANVQAGYLNLDEIKTITIAEDEFDRYRLQPGDLLLTEGGDFDKLGRGAVWHGEIDLCIHQNHIFAVRFDGTVVLPEFAEYEVLSAYAKSYFLGVAKKTTNLATINKAQLSAFPLRYPSLEEQNAIVEHLDDVKAQAAEIRHVQEDEGTLLDDLGQSILSQAFRGELM